LAQRSWASPASLLSFVLLQEDSARVRHCSVSRGALRCAFVRARVRARARACVRACVRARVGGWVRARACACVRARLGGGWVRACQRRIARAASLLIFEGPRGATPQPIDQLRCLLLLLGEEVYMSTCLHGWKC